MPSVIIQKLTSTDGFIAFDLDDAPAAGVTRSAPKILVDGASLLARSLTYRFATFERQVGGASAGVNAAPDDRAAALAAFVAEVEPLVRDGRLADRPGQGRHRRRPRAAARPPIPGPDAYARPPRRAHRPRRRGGRRTPPSRGLAGRRVAIEGFDASGPAIVAGVAEPGRQGRGHLDRRRHRHLGRRASTTATVAAAWAEHGAALVGAAGRRAGQAVGGVRGRGRRARGRRRSPA